jgi:hypothetical protein
MNVVTLPASSPLTAPGPPTAASKWEKLSIPDTGRQSGG